MLSEVGKPEHRGPQVGKLKSLEMLRAFAALLVVMGHATWIFGAGRHGTPFGGVFRGGYRGVDLFFVLSGFIIAYVHGSDVGRSGRVANYAFNRFARIFPALWIVTLLAGGVYAFGFGGAEKAGKLSDWSTVASFLLLPQDGDALVGVSWTLKYEMFFYVLFGLLILHRRLGLGLLVGWQAATLLWSLVSTTEQREAYNLLTYYLNPMCLEFGVGLATAWVFVRRPDAVWWGSTGDWVLVTAGTACFALAMRIGQYPHLAGVPAALGSAAIILGLARLERRGAFRVSGLLVVLGGASYAIYLVHYSVLRFLELAFGRLHVLPANDLVILAAATAAVGMGVVFARLIDQPLQFVLHRRLKPKLLPVDRHRAVVFGKQKSGALT